MELVTVTYSGDKEHMHRQSMSINKFVEGQTTHRVVIQDDVMSIQEWYDYLAPLYTNHKLYIVPNTIKFDPTTPYHSGWIQQQILKFTVSTYINSEYYLILDSKNFFCKKTNLDEWPITEGNGCVVTIGHSEYNKWLPFSKIVASELNRPVVTFSWDPLSPFKVKTRTVKQLVKDLDLEPLFQTRDPNPSEFVLYSYYDDTKKYKNEKRPFVTIYDSISVTLEMLDEIDNDSHIKMFAIHRDYTDRITISNVNSWLIRLGIDPHFNLIN